MESLIASFTAELSHPEYTNSESGYGFGRSYGSGSGSKNSSGSGYGCGSGYGSGYGDGGGYGDNDGYDDGCYGHGYGGSNGCGSGYGFVGDDDDDDDSDGTSGCGYGSGNLQYVKTYCGKPVYNVNGAPTVIDSVRHGVAFGAMLRIDLTTIPCVIVRNGHTYAHGATLKEAKIALQTKLRHGMAEEEFVE